MPNVDPALLCTPCHPHDGCTYDCIHSAANVNALTGRVKEPKSDSCCQGFHGRE